MSLQNHYFTFFVVRVMIQKLHRRFLGFDIGDEVDEVDDMNIEYRKIIRNYRAELLNVTQTKRYQPLISKGWLRSDLRIHPFGCMCQLCS